MALSGKLDEVGEADRWIWERLGHIWVFLFKVKITEKMHAEIVEQLEAKLAAGEIPDEEVKTVETVEASTRRPRF